MTDRELSEAVSTYIQPGSTVAIGGAGLSRKPMAAIRALAERGVRDLTVVSFLGSVDVELLLAAGCISELHSAGVSLDGFGLAPGFRAARQTATLQFVEWSEGSLVAALEAASRGVPSMPCRTGPESDVVANNPSLELHDDPFTGESLVFAEAISPDVALLHGSATDRAGNVYIDGDPGIDGLLARASRSTIATVSTLRDGDPSAAAISRLFVDTVLVEPHGSWPTSCHPDALVDLEIIAAWAAADGTDRDILMREPS